jgi:hypothetical protein
LATVSGLTADVAVTAPGLQVAVYPVIAEPPVAGAVKPSDTDALPGVIDEMAGAAGGVE